MQVNDNGIISLDVGYNLCTPLPLPLRVQIIVPYCADVDTREVGTIYYRQSSDPDLLNKAANDISKGFPMSQNVTVTNLLIATWDAVGYYSHKSDKVVMITM